MEDINDIFSYIRILLLNNFTFTMKEHMRAFERLGAARIVSCRRCPHGTKCSA